MADELELRAGDARATIARLGAEPLAWAVGGRDLLWHGDPAHWGFRAPILFPTVGASKNNEIRVGGHAYPMAQHGFARRSRFALVDRTDDRATLRLVDSDETRRHFPFPFRLDVAVTLEPSALAMVFAVTNTGDGAMPYGLGFHPAFPWPVGGGSRESHRVVFAEAERTDVPEVAAGGLLARRTRPVPLDGTVLPLSPDLFSEALVFLDARSRCFDFAGPAGAIRMETTGFPHLAVWSKPTAPFLSLEAWAGHADWEDATGDLETRAANNHLAPGETGRHAVRLLWKAN